MKKILTFIMVITTITSLYQPAFAQDDATANQELTMGIPEVLLIDAVNDAGVVGAVSLELTTVTAGTAISGGTGTSYAQVSSIVASGQTRTITAAVTGVPAGTALSVTTTVPSNANQAGTVGTGTSNVPLINAAAASTIVSGIGSCYTGTSSGDGYQLDWIWDAGAAGDYGSIVATTGSTATVVLTITAGV